MRKRSIQTCRSQRRIRDTSEAIELIYPLFFRNHLAEMGKEGVGTCPLLSDTDLMIHLKQILNLKMYKLLSGVEMSLSPQCRCFGQIMLLPSVS